MRSGQKISDGCNINILMGCFTGDPEDTDTVLLYCELKEGHTGPHQVSGSEPIFSGNSPEPNFVPYKLEFGNTM